MAKRCVECNADGVRPHARWLTCGRAQCIKAHKRKAQLVHNRRYYDANATRLVAYARRYRSEHPEQGPEYRRRRADYLWVKRRCYYAANRERCYEAARRWRLEHLDWCAQRMRRWRAAHPEESRAISRRSNARRREQTYEYNRIYRRRNREVLLRKSRERWLRLTAALILYRELTGGLKHKDRKNMHAIARAFKEEGIWLD